MSVPVEYFRRLFRSIFISVPTEDFLSKVLKIIFCPKFHWGISEIFRIFAFYSKDFIVFYCFSHCFSLNHFGHFVWFRYKLVFESEKSGWVKYFRRLFRTIFISVPTEEICYKVLKIIFWVNSGSKTNNQISHFCWNTVETLLNPYCNFLGICLGFWLGLVRKTLKP